MTAHLCKGCIINHNQGGGSKKAGLSTTVGFTKRSNRFMNMKKFKPTNNFFIKYVLEFYTFLIKNYLDIDDPDSPEYGIMKQRLNDLFTKHIPANPFSPQSDRALASFSNDTKKIAETFGGHGLEISFNSPTSNKMYKDMNNEFSTVRSLIIEYLKKPNKKNKQGLRTVVEAHSDYLDDKGVQNYLFFLLNIWFEVILR